MKTPSFDRLCWLSENCAPLRTLDKMLREAHLFHFPGVPHEVLPRELADAEATFHAENFVMPFRVTAIEDPASCLLFWDDKPDARGLVNTRRWFVECASLSDEAAKAWNDGEQESAVRKTMTKEVLDLLERTWSVSFGYIDSIMPRLKEDRTGYDVLGAVYGLYLFDGESLMESEWVKTMADTMIPQIQRNAVSGIEEIIYFNRPDRFIVRESPPRVRDPQTSAKIPRTQDRPIYTILHPHEIRNKLGLTTDAHRSAHERRRHVRRYPEDPVRWPKAHGKTVVIPASWVGPAEATVGRRTYKVMLDL